MKLCLFDLMQNSNGLDPHIFMTNSLDEDIHPFIYFIKCLCHHRFMAMFPNVFCVSWDSCTRGTVYQESPSLSFLIAFFTKPWLKVIYFISFSPHSESQFFCLTGENKYYINLQAKPYILLLVRKMWTTFKESCLLVE